MTLGSSFEMQTALQGSHRNRQAIKCVDKMEPRPEPPQPYPRHRWP